MPASLDEWLDQHWERTLAEQTSQVDTANLIVTFVLAIASTLVASALQTSPQNALDLWASIVLGVAFMTALGVFFIDRPKGVNQSDLLKKAAANNWSAKQTLDYITVLMRDLTDKNSKNAKLVAQASQYQIIVSGLAGTLGVISLLQPIP